MSLSEEDIQATAKIATFKTKSLLADRTHHFRSRQIVQFTGDLSELAEISVGGVPEPNQKGRFVSLLSEDGFLDADLFISPIDGGALIDVHADLVRTVSDRLAGLKDVSCVDDTAHKRWRVLGETPDQKAADTQYETIRFADTRRRELGTRVFRDASEPEGQDWRHSRKWDGHAMRLGILPDHRCIIGKGVKPEEAGYHRLVEGTPHTDPLEIKRRILPIRVDTYSDTVPIMAGCNLMADGEVIGIMLDQEGVCGVALISIDPWRDTTSKGLRITCQDFPVIVTWPTWLSSESAGRYGPAGTKI